MASASWMNHPVRSGWWPGAWVSAGLLANAALITTIGFIRSCTLCYVLAVQGLRRAEGRAAVVHPHLPIGRGQRIRDLGAGVLDVHHFLAINLPGLTGTG